MSDWQPIGSSAYDTAYADGDFHTVGPNDASSPAYFSTTPYREPAARSSKHCIANDRTCKGFKSQGTEFCSGHNKALAKAAGTSA